MAKSSPISVVPYQAAWATAFSSLHHKYASLLDDLILSVEHVGSTSVPGLSAKPIIDIDIVVRNFDRLDIIVSKLESIGYKHRGDLGVPLREAFLYIGDEALPAHHLYVCQEGCDSLLNHLTVRDHLLANPQAVELYGELKSALAEKYPYDMDSYIEGKTDFLVGILRKAGFAEEKLSKIVSVNKKKG